MNRLFIPQPHYRSLPGQRPSGGRHEPGAGSLPQQGVDDVHGSELVEVDKLHLASFSLALPTQ